MGKDEVKGTGEGTEAPAPESINPKFLAGIKIRGAEKKEVKEDGKPRVKYIPFERDAKPEDVIAWKDNGARMTIVTCDGKKYNVDKKGK
jgi:hypothetical protein